MSDHGSGPRALTDPVSDIADLYAFPSPDRQGALVLVMNVFPFAEPGAFFSDAVDYRFRLRPARIAATRTPASFEVAESEYSFTCTFSPPHGRAGALAQNGVCTASSGQQVTFEVNDMRGAQADGLRVFAGLRMDPFFGSAEAILETITTQRLAFKPEAHNTLEGYNVLSIVVEADVAALLGTDGGPLFAVAAETARTGPVMTRLERVGRPDIKNTVLFAKNFDQVNRDLEIRDLYNLEDPFHLGPAYLGAYRARLHANLAFFDRLDGRIDWPPTDDGAHPLTELLLADFLVVDVSKPFAEDGYLEIEQAMLRGVPHTTCGGRWLNHDVLDTVLTFLVNRGNGPRITDGVDQATRPASTAFPYLVPPNASAPTAVPGVAVQIGSGYGHRD
jgi:hypothetical protein